MMAYTRLNVYPDGGTIPSSLPDSYMPAAYGAPAGQNCFTCGYLKLTTTMKCCTKWDAEVKTNWWCKAWTPLWQTKP
jgi:hypothetical protein